MSTSKRKTKKQPNKAKSAKSKVISMDYDTWFFFAERDGEVKTFQKADEAETHLQKS
jgi:hypothetical protein